MHMLSSVSFHSSRSASTTLGMNEKEFAGELFDVLARRRGIVTGTITKTQLRDFWDQLSDQSFDACIQTNGYANNMSRYVRDYSEVHKWMRVSGVVIDVSRSSNIKCIQQKVYPQIV